MTELSESTAANLGFEAQLWAAADALRSDMDVAEYKHVVLGPIFLEYISDAFEEQHTRLRSEIADGADPEDPDEYRLGQLIDLVSLPDLRADYVISNSPFNDSDWHGDRLPSPRGQGIGGEVFSDLPGFYKFATIDDIRQHGYVLTPGRYVGVEAAEEDDETIEEKMIHLVAQLQEQMSQAHTLDNAIARNLKELGYGLPEQ